MVVRDDLSDGELVRKAREGDNGAFGTLVSRYMRAAYAVSRSVTGGHQDAEDAVQEAFIVALERLEAEFHDYNEARVSSILELERVFENTTAPEWKALRVRSVLTFVFESFYAYEFESLRRKNIDQAKRLLSRVPHLSLFPRVYTLNQALGSHLVPLDESMRDTGVWLGLVSRGHSPQRAGNVLKSVIRKDA